MTAQNQALTTSQLAQLYNLHPNTIRLYESSGYLTPAKRGKNGYRHFSQLQVLQLEICRCIYGFPFFNHNIRNLGNQIMTASGSKSWSQAKTYTDRYIETIENEIRIAETTAVILQAWAEQQNPPTTPVHKELFSRKQAAAYLGVTTEAIRNWERNQLITPQFSKHSKETLYSATTLEKMQVIYMLRQASYSMAAIHHSLSVYHQGETKQVAEALNQVPHQEILSVGDQWRKELDKLLLAAKEIPAILAEIIVFCK